MKTKPNRKTIAASVRGSVPAGKLVKARIVQSDSRGERLGGFTEFGRKNGEVSRIAVPDGISDYDTVVRGHECAHATFHGVVTRRKPKTKNEEDAGQRIDDVNVECKPIPSGTLGNVRRYRRAHLTAAMKDLHNMLRSQRMVKSGQQRDTVARRNMVTLTATRVMAMLMHYRNDPTFRHVAEGAGARGLRRLRDLIGDSTYHALNIIIHCGRSDRKRNRAISMLTALLETEPTHELEDMDAPEGPKVDSDILSPVVEGDALDGHMEIRDLQPKSEHTSKEKRAAIRPASSGVLVNAARFVNAIVSHNADGLFRRRIKEKGGGTVVIDASGSMRATARNLSALCALCPTATVAYYSGTDRGRGVLSVYAYKGKRYSGELPEDTLLGNNCIDLPAVRWMMRQQKPWTLVSDLEFCGGVIGSEAIAHALVERAEMRGELTVYRSLDAAYEAFGGEGDLKN